MRGKKALCIILTGMSVLSCGLRPQKSASPRFTPQDAGYTGKLLPTFYYTEGMKRGMLYGDPEGAVKIFDKAIAADSTHAPSYYEAANALIGTDPARALPYSQKANRLDTANLWYQSQLGRLMVINKEFGKAQDIYERLTREAPRNPENYRMLAALYEQNGQPFTAISLLDSAENRLGRMEELAGFKLQLLIQVKLYDKAIAESKALIRDFPYKEENYLVLAELYAATGKDSLARVCYDEALALNPTSANVLGAMNDYYKKKGDDINFMATARQLFNLDDVPAETKIAFFEELIRDIPFYRDHYFQMNDLASTLLIKYPKDYRVLKLYANHLIASGSTEEALKLYKTFVADSVSLDAYNNILDIEAYLQRPDSVSKYATEALAHFPRNAELHIRHGSILAFLKREREALDSYRNALKYAGSDSLRSVVYGIMGDAFHQKNQTNKSYAYYEKALRADSSNAMVLNNYSYFLSTSDRELEKALKMGRRATELSPGNPTYLDTYAWACYKLGQYAEAKKVMQQAISLDRSNSAELSLHYGDILYRLNDYFMASVYWKKALERGYDAEEIAERFKLIKGK
ncbi:tetratricopeptide repeat protein [Gallalistipes aquisgranensis]|uniref:tetratricopeptide repeat protein n=1 Tax=Gallalistipes aquisgranensis TaxID=2779358 RepID=UPI001CF8229A|nr:tetratricopeptide repeat protein [Gallalistipes aquisgranensis]MBE5034468.1 tetratricopeptide repeat protein [Gallalistipes aquisgranensis]